MVRNILAAAVIGIITLLVLVFVGAIQVGGGSADSEMEIEAPSETSG